MLQEERAEVQRRSELVLEARQNDNPKVVPSTSVPSTQSKPWVAKDWVLSTGNWVLGFD